MLFRSRAIDRYLEERNNIVLTDNKALFGSRDKNRISVSAVHRLVKKHLLESGLDASQFSAHKLRHTAATLMLANGVDLRLGCDVTGADFTAKTVSYTDEKGEAHVESYDKLLIATGSSPKVPPIPGIRQKNIFPLKTLDQAAALKLALESNPKSVVIVGGGYIGLELAEACILQKVPEIHIVEALDRLLNVFDPEFSEMVKAELEKNGVHIHLGERVMSFEGEDDKVTAVKTDKDC